jgi:hypothetical protein
MSITMYSASVPVFVRLLDNMGQWLAKAQAHAESKKFDSVNFLSTRLAPDMLPLSKQVQIACDSAKFAVARLGGVDAPAFQDNEATIAELQDRITRTKEFIASVPQASIDGTETKDIAVPRRNGTITLQGEFYLKHFALPNFYFHATTTYALLRHNGVELGKMDFLGAIS